MISSFYINIDSCFYYDLEKFSNFNKFVNDINKYKLTKEELNKLNIIANNIKESNNGHYSTQSIEMIPELYENYKKLEIIKKIKNNKTIIIQKIIENNFPNKNFSLRKIKNKYQFIIKSKISICTISILYYMLLIFEI